MNTYICIYTHIYIYIYMRTNLGLPLRDELLLVRRPTDICIHIYIFTYIYTYIYMNKCMTYTQIYIYKD